ncbi:hypothetical protein LQ50_15545 [Halalkalibacter okhensis]|uniref:Orotidine 5'-phosphate decarboxylase n=2 Tax=Halalkalibacter okhensis TaxID=333138 RepID=A0A0B0IF20_9BACI|nr:hypothetical protein LQ50_15545 [Halalkalibacter okhensis]
MHKHFGDVLCEQVKLKKSHAAIGLDPNLDKFPHFILDKAVQAYGKNPEGASFAIETFNKLVIDTIKNNVAVIKLQLAYYEVYGSHGMKAFWETVRYGQEQGLIVIADAKRGDIDTTATAYAEAFLGGGMWNHSNQTVADAITINPYMGKDSIEPFANVAWKKGCGVFALVKTSNPSSIDFQDQELECGSSVSEKVSVLLSEFGQRYIGKEGYSSIGAVIGATYPDKLKLFREKMPHSFFLVPGYGTQGGTGDGVVNAFNGDGLGALISASRSIIYSYIHDAHTFLSEEKMRLAIEKSLAQMNQDINAALLRNNKLVHTMNC